MRKAAQRSFERGGLNEADVERVAAILKAADLPVTAPANMQAEDFLARMRLDKKNLDDRLRLILLEALGKACVRDDTEADRLERLLANFPRA